MNIGILTHHYVKNFGAYMQAYGLFSAIKENFPKANVEFIDYKVKQHKKATTIHFFGFKPQRGDTISGFIKKMGLFFTHKKYENGLPLSKRVKTAEEINLLNYDLIIIGSDEVWNFNDIAYSPVKFGVNLKLPHITYSASAGGSTANDGNIPNVIIKGMKSFNHIAVRDEKTQELVRLLTGLDSERTLDPVYIYDYDLNNVREKVRKTAKQKPYILIYDCHLSEKQKELLKNYANEKNYNIIGAGEYRNWYSTTDTVNINPYEWAYLFKNAQSVITGTFHGTSFAIKYNRPFVAYLTEHNRINKVGSLLKEFNLEKQIAGKDDSIVEIINQSIDYNSVNEIIKIRKRDSLKYICKCIDEVNKNEKYSL